MAQETRKQEIIRVAAELFKNKGYSAVTMRDLASAIDIKAASLYNHINSKQDILKVIIISIAEDFTSGMQSIIDSKKSSISKLRDVIALHVRLASNNINGMAALNNDWMHLEDQLDFYLKLRSDYENNFMEIIKSGIETKEIKNCNPEVIMFSILTTLRSLYLWIPKKEALNANELSQNLNQVLIDGITNK